MSIRVSTWLSFLVVTIGLIVQACCISDYSESRYLVVAGFVRRIPPPAGSSWDAELHFGPSDHDNAVLREAAAFRSERRGDRLMLYLHFLDADIHAPTAELLTFIPADNGRVLDLPGEFHDYCGYDAVSYDLTALSEGEYEVIHHRAAVPPRSVWANGALDWEMVDGEEVASTTIVIGNPPLVADGGMSDAGILDGGP